MSQELETLGYALRQWFGRHDISTENLTIIINIADQQAASQFDRAFKQDYDRSLVRLPHAPAIATWAEFKLMGLKFRVESPLHNP